MGARLDKAPGRWGPFSRARRNIRFRLFAIARRNRSFWKWKSSFGSINHRGHRENLISHKKAQEAQKDYQQRLWFSFSRLCLLCIFVADFLFSSVSSVVRNPTVSINLKTQFLCGAGLCQSIDDGHLQEVGARLESA